MNVRAPHATSDVRFIQGSKFTRVGREARDASCLHVRLSFLTTDTFCPLVGLPMSHGCSPKAQVEQRLFMCPVHRCVWGDGPSIPRGDTVRLICLVMAKGTVDRRGCFLCLSVFQTSMGVRRVCLDVSVDFYS